MKVREYLLYIRICVCICKTNENNKYDFMNQQINKPMDYKSVYTNGYEHKKAAMTMRINR